nr:PorV/PorQ family protein [Hymenobacter cellulosilyticus]
MLGVSIAAQAQSSPNTITTAVPILTLSPDARSAALGEAGVAISPDANASYHNAGKLGFVTSKYGVSPSYSPWLRNVTDDMGLAYLSGFSKLGQRSAISASLMYFDLGTISFRDEKNNPKGDFNPRNTR